jgi:glycosyltransferase involved in cell wall biosynthesis
LKQEGTELTVATPSNAVTEFTEVKGERIRYFLFPLGKGNLKKNDEYRKYWRIIHDLVQPDVVHIHGTEFSHGLAYIDECGANNVVVSIQGLTSEIAKYYSLGLPKIQILRNLSIGDLFRGSVFSDVRRYRERGKVEIELIKKVHHIIGRTSFDRSHTWAINPDAKYHFCNEILREEFYSGRWQYENCQSHTIFFSQANNPLKGLHFLLRALTIVKESYPDVKLNIAGRDITAHKSTLRGIYAYSGYGKIIKRLILKNNLQQTVSFLGPLSAGQMKEALLNSNVFVCSSSIENSSNSLAEAQMLGVPCVASFVGGLPDLVPNQECGRLYRSDDVVGLAFQICDLFRSSDSFNNSIMREFASNRHNRRNNIESLLSIYQQLL